MAIYNFRNKATEDINYGRVTKNSLKLLPKTLHQKAQIKLARISAAGKYVDRSWEHINCSQSHECGNWERGRAIPKEAV